MHHVQSVAVGVASERVESSRVESSRVESRLLDCGARLEWMCLRDSAYFLVLRTDLGTLRIKWPFYGSSTWFLYQRDIFAECPNKVLSQHRHCFYQQQLTDNKTHHASLPDPTLSTIYCNWLSTKQAVAGQVIEQEEKPTRKENCARCKGTRILLRGLRFEERMLYNILVLFFVPCRKL
jgi:hypothetical protein